MLKPSTVDTRYSAELFSLLAYGEHLAAHSALKQSQLTDNKKLSRFFYHQSQQEQFHATLIESGIRYLATVRQYKTPKALVQIGDFIHQRIEQKALTASVLGMQVVIETLGELILTKIDHTMEQQRFGLKPLRRLILNQEKAHAAFGERFIIRSLQQSPGREQLRKDLTKDAEIYQALCAQLFEELNGLFEHFELPKEDYSTTVENTLNSVLSERPIKN